MSYINMNWASGGHWQINQPVQLKAASDLFHPTADQKYPIGALYTDRFGGKYRYEEDSGSGITKARMAAAEAPASTLNDEVQTAYGVAAAKQKFDILVTTGNGLSAHDLIDGWMYCNSGDAIGDMYLIKDNKWTTSDTVLNIEIADQGGIRTAIAATDTLTLIKNIFKDVNVHPADRTAMAVGVPLVTVTASYYFWAKTRGPAPMYVDNGDTLVIGGPCGEPSGTANTAGAVGAVANDGTDAVWGRVMSVEPGDDVALVYLMLE